MKLCFIDTETTGLNHYKDRIWQISGRIRIDGKNKETFNITNKRSEKDLYKEFISILNKYVDKFNKSDKLFMVAYNSRFDENFIRSMFDRNKNKFYGSYFYNPSICTMQMASLYFLKRPKIKRPDSFKLSEVCKYFKIPFDDNKAHDALYDSNANQKLYNRLIKK